MKKVLVFIIVAGVALILLAAKLPATGFTRKSANKTKNNSCGYRIIEFGLGVNCKGDTVKLIKSKGFQQLASYEEASAPGA